MSSVIATTETYIHSPSHSPSSISSKKKSKKRKKRNRSMACVADREAAVREVAQVYELIKLQHPLLLLHQPPPSSTTQLAQSLLGKALRALKVALSVMKQQEQPAAAPVTPVSVVKAEPHQLSPPISPASADSQAMAPRRGAKRRRSSVAMEGKKKTSSSWTTITAVPYDDGYEWRKYGEKKINGTLFTRSYFRCTYKQDDAGCFATKQVQQMDNSDPPMFHVTYNNDHTCSSARANTGSSNLAALLAGCCDMMKKQEPTGQQHAAAAAMDMKQEPPLLLLPALVDLQPASACFPHEQIPASACFAHEQIPPCQEPLFPVSMEQQLICGAFRDDDGEIPSATGSSCISGETSCCWDGYSYSGDMAVAQDDPLHDLEHFLFMDY